MNNKNADFLLRAIGELSENTIAEAKLPSDRPARGRIIDFTRRYAVRAASIILFIAMVAAVVFSFTSGQTATSPASPAAAATEATVSMDFAVKAAMDSLKESGVSAKLSKASFIFDEEQPYYIVKLSTDDGIYDCSVDARSGKVTDITYNSSNNTTDNSNNKTKTDKTGKGSAAPEDDDDDSAYSDVMPDSYEASNTARSSGSHSVAVIEKPTAAPTAAPIPEEAPDAVVDYAKKKEEEKAKEKAKQKAEENASSNNWIDQMFQDSIEKTNKEWAEKNSKQLSKSGGSSGGGSDPFGLTPQRTESGWSIKWDPNSP